MAQPPPTIPAALLASSEAHGDSAALVAGGRRITYAELKDRVLRAGAVLRSRGVGKGDRVAIWMPNGPEWVEAALGAACIGAVMVPVNTRLKPREADYILKKSGARLMLASRDFLGRDYAAEAEALALPALEAVMAAGGPDAAWSAALDAVASDEAEETLRQAQAIAPEDLAEVIFTSGTTGFPKGAMLSHRQIVRAYLFYAGRAGMQAGDRYLIVAPMFHSFGFKAGVVVSILKGAAIYPVPVFDVHEALETIERERITLMGGPPTIFTSLLDLNEREGRDLSSLRSIVLGGNMISPALVRKLREQVGVDIVLTAYGLTETTALVTMTRREDGVERISTTAGQLVDGMEMRCVDRDDREVPRGEPGEIQARGANVTAGYFDDPEATAAAFTDDGWLRTGDIGVIDQAGYLTVTDRKKDMFIVGGFNCYPAEIEAIMGQHPAVGEAAVIGVPDQRLGEVAKAFIVPREGQDLEAEAFIAWCRENMANFKVPRYVETLEALPRNAMGKVQKFLLRERPS